MVEGKTSTGFNFKYDERILEDYRLLEVIGQFDETSSKVGQAKALKDMVDYIFGEAKEAFFEHIKAQNDGYMPIEKIQSEIIEIIKASKELKN